MIAVDLQGVEHTGSVSKFMTGWRLASYTLDERDVAWIMKQNDHMVLCIMHQLAARIPNDCLRRPDGRVVMDTKGAVRVLNNGGN